MGLLWTYIYFWISRISLIFFENNIFILFFLNLESWILDLQATIWEFLWNKIPQRRLSILVWNKSFIIGLALQGFIQAILMSRWWHQKLNFLIEFWNSIFIRFYVKHIEMVWLQACIQNKLACFVSIMLKENFTLMIFFSFCLNWPRMGFYNLIYKDELFFFQSSHFNTICARYIDGLLFINPLSANPTKWPNTLK